MILIQYMFFIYLLVSSTGPSPTNDQYENNRIVGQRQADKAYALYNGATEFVTRGIDIE
jgi:hypothetical protein